VDLFNVSHYRILQKLGSGGSAEVFLAEDSRLHRKVALKLLHRHLTEDHQKVARFQQEAQWACVLNHPNILTIYEVGESSGAHFIATEYIEGETLRKRMDRPIPLLEVLDIAIGIGSGLIVAHEAWIVHRDIKPENVMLRRDGYVKVLDFGVAKLTQNFGAGPAIRTEPRLIMGTLEYMAPEQLRAQGVDPRTDLFSLGTVLYEMIAGVAPFRGNIWTEVMTSILEDEPPPLVREGEAVPQELQDIVRRALQKEMNARFQSASEMVGLLKELREDLRYRERQLRLGGP
jgi:serine/threonine protein kinase